MLIPLSRQKFEQLIPVVATGSQYIYYWGKINDLIKRLLISVVSIIVLLLVNWILPDLYLLFLLIGIIGGLYWLWGPVFWASLRNRNIRRYEYAAFWQGEIIDYYVTDEIIGEEQTVNQRGQLIIVENREKKLNIEVGDDTDFFSELKVPLKKNYKVIRRGEIAEMLLFSNRRDFSNIVDSSDIYIPDHKLWISDYPTVRRDIFIDVSRQLQKNYERDRYDDDNYDDDYPPRRNSPPRKKRRSRR
jgi:hypothetical protein